MRTSRSSLLALLCGVCASLPALGEPTRLPPPQAQAQTVPSAAPSLQAGAERPTEAPPAQAAPPPAPPPNAPPAQPVAPTQSVAPAQGSPPLKPKPPAPLKFASVSSDPRPTLDPETSLNTLRAAERYREIAESGGWPTLPAGAALKAGDRGSAVSTLKERLALTDDLRLEDRRGDVFDGKLVAALKHFQARHGLPETGLVGPKTRDALNVPAVVRVRQLTMSAERLAGSRFAFGERYVVVNIPAATVEAVEGGRVARRYVAVVGKKDRASPTVETRITNINLNPTWTVPISLVKKDIIPQMRQDPSYLSKMKIRIFGASGQEIEPHRIDWATERATAFTLRQDAGAANSLGQIRIDMPNKHAVYLHDTPSKRLFTRDDRFHSSGCVRVGSVKEFAAWLLEGSIGPTGPWTVADLDAGIAAAARHDIKLVKPVPVAWVYLTGYATPDGTAHFRDDVYDLDRSAPMPPPAPASADDLTTSSITRRDR